jgi:glycosyltransferase involved in cell wall biosynthesis
MPQVSVIVLTYNPDNRKLRQTLSAIAAQQDISLELIISDDGSANKDFSFLPEFMSAHNIADYVLLEHSQNLGTVQNCRSAVAAATGDYVFLTSPGDYLFDPYVLRDFYCFTKSSGAAITFGNAVFYAASDKQPLLTRNYGTPAAPQLYNASVSRKQVKASFFSGNWIIGASYFRNRELMLSWLNQISDTSKYMEDTPTSAIALAENHRICYYDRNIVWYEDGTGVSTGSSTKWEKLLHQDALLTFQKLKQQYPKDPYIDLTYCNLSQKSRIKRILYKLVLHPILSVQIALTRAKRHQPIVCTEKDLQRLSNLLKIE